MNYADFLKVLDKKLNNYAHIYQKHIMCKKGCASCCKNGNYPISQLELDYIMKGYISLDDNLKKIIQKNIATLQKGGECPFLINNECAIYEYRPVVCRVHGLAYMNAKNIVITPYCANEGKNYSSVYKNNLIEIEPIKENLDTPNLLKDFEYGEIRDLYDWLIV